MGLMYNYFTNVESHSVGTDCGTLKCENAAICEKVAKCNKIQR